MLNNLKIWWQDPRRAADAIEHRKVSFLELFYDLAYVGYIAQITHGIAEHPALEHLLQYLFLFVIGWWAWSNGSLYHEVHGNNDIRTRVFTFLQLIAIIFMAIFAHSAFGAGDIGYIISFTFFMIVITFLWYRTGLDPAHRPMSIRYSIMFALSAIAFFSSMFVDGEVRYYLWLLSVFLSFVAPVWSGLRMRRDDVPDSMQLIVRESFSERIGLFMIIVIGEVVFAIVNTAAVLHHFDRHLIGIITMSILFAIALWWIYFDYVSHRMPRADRNTSFGWMFSHLPMLIGISVSGSCVSMIIAGEHVIEEPSFRFLFIGSVLAFLLGVLTVRVFLDPGHFVESFNRSRNVLITGVIGIVVLVFFNLSAAQLLQAIVVIFYLMIAAIIGLAMIDLQRHPLN